MLKNLIFGEPSRQFIKLPKKSKIIKSFFTFLIGIFLSNSSNSQSIETLRHNWQYGKSDTAKINAGLKLIIDYYYGSNDSLFAENKILKKIYNASIKCNYQKGIIESSCFIGNNYTSQGLPQKAIEYFYISLKISEKYHYDKGIARAKMSIGIIYYGQNNWAKAI